MKQMVLSRPASMHADGPFNDVKGKVQRIRMSSGCPNACPYCHENTTMTWHGIPEIVRNHVQILDMNFLSWKGAIAWIKELGEKRVDGCVIYYEMVCGFDYRRLTIPIACELKHARFQRPRIAWDGPYGKQHEIKRAIDALLDGGYHDEDIMVFMICNWKVSFDECMKKLDLLKVWGVHVADCYYDGQVFPRVNPVFWTDDELRTFRARCRKHNQLVRFKFDPEVLEAF